MPRFLDKSEYEQYRKERVILDFVRENQPISGNVILEIFHRISLRDFEKRGQIKYYENDNQIGWVLANYSPQKYSKSFDPSTVECLIREGNILLEYRKFTKAILRFQEVLKRDKKNIDALYSLSLATIQSAKKDEIHSSIEKALKFLNKIISIDPTHHNAVSEIKLVILYQKFLKNKRELKKIFNEREKKGFKHPRKHTEKTKKLRSEITQMRKELADWRNDRFKNPNRVKGANLAWAISNSLQKKLKDEEKIRKYDKLREIQLSNELKTDLAEKRKQLDNLKKSKKR